MFQRGPESGGLYYFMLLTKISSAFNSGRRTDLLNMMLAVKKDLDVFLQEVQRRSARSKSGLLVVHFIAPYRQDPKSAWVMSTKSDVILTRMRKIE